jgi:hypothetical protein
LESSNDGGNLTGARERKDTGGNVIQPIDHRSRLIPEPDLSGSQENLEPRQRELHRYEINGVPLLAYDEEGSLAADRVAGELASDVYGLEMVPFQPGDVAIDIGAHIGLVSIYIAKRWPFLRIYAFEPYLPN